MVVQDRNYQTALNINDMVLNLFGINAIPSGTSTDTYYSKADFTLLPINPQEPGRFNVIRDFKMFVAPGYRMDYYKKVMLLQRDLFSGGRFYAGTNQNTSAVGPADNSSNWSQMRNRVYVVFLY